jgi:hypothetical protein
MNLEILNLDLKKTKMETLLYNIVGIALIVNFFLYWFTPIQPLRDKLEEKLSDLIVKYNLYFMSYFLTLLSCVQCMSFWVGLIYFQDFISALMTSFVAIVFNIVIKKYQNE